MAHPALFAIFVGIGLGMAIYYAVSTQPQLQVNRPYRAYPPPSNSAKEDSWRTDDSGQKERMVKKKKRSIICGICSNTMENYEDGESCCGNFFHSKCLTFGKVWCPTCLRNMQH